MRVIGDMKFLIHVHLFKRKYAALQGKKIKKKTTTQLYIFPYISKTKITN